MDIRCLQRLDGGEISANNDEAVYGVLETCRRLPRFEPEIEMKPEAVGIRHKEQRERDGEENPEGEARVLGDGLYVRQIK